MENPHSTTTERQQALLEKTWLDKMSQSQRYGSGGFSGGGGGGGGFDPNDPPIFYREESFFKEKPAFKLDPQWTARVAFHLTYNMFFLFLQKTPLRKKDKPSLLKVSIPDLQSGFFDKMKELQEEIRESYEKETTVKRLVNHDPEDDNEGKKDRYFDPKFTIMTDTESFFVRPIIVPTVQGPMLRIILRNKRDHPDHPNWMGPNGKMGVACYSRLLKYIEKMITDVLPKMEKEIKMKMFNADLNQNMADLASQYQPAIEDLSDAEEKQEANVVQ